jgi:hypothetical protein
MKAPSIKKINKLNRKHETRITDAAQAVLAMRGWPFKNRFKFAWWLLFGRGEWKGV